MHTMTRLHLASYLPTCSQLASSSGPVVVACGAYSLSEELAVHLQLAGAAVVPMKEIATKHAVAPAIFPPAEGALAVTTRLGAGRALRQEKHTWFLHPTCRNQLLGHHPSLLVFLRPTAATKL